MSYIVTCYTLFDITQTGIINRGKPSDGVDEVEWLHKKKTQCNFDTILQAISLRSLPEVIKNPELIKIKFNEFTNFGFLFEQQGDETFNCWKFEFSVQNSSVFDDGKSELGGLYSDCEGVPMLKCDTSWEKLPQFLDSSDEMRNIYFTLTENEENF